MMPAGNLLGNAQLLRFGSIRAQTKAAIHPTRNNGVNSKSITQIAKKCE
jgi:hypothetical protein